MIISKLSGGLGNQLFQYAIGRALAIKKHTRLLLDDSFYASESNKKLQRTLLLKKFNVKYEIATLDDINKVLYTKNYIRAFKRHILRKKTPYFLENKICEKEMYFDSNIHKCNKNVYLEGYWPNENYFIEIREILLAEIKLLQQYVSNEYLSVKKNIENSANTISIHIRRGDYVNDGTYQIFGLCTLEYYYNAISYITQHIENPNFHIFTDDVFWVEENFKTKFPLKIISSPLLNDYEELEIMSLCKHNIIANSTFSWWGAWLNENPTKIVIAPQKWYNDENFQYFYENSNFVPASWIRL